MIANCPNAQGGKNSSRDSNSIFINDGQFYFRSSLFELQIHLKYGVNIDNSTIVVKWLKHLRITPIKRLSARALFVITLCAFGYSLECVIHSDDVFG
jgi:hypothetical protein